MTLDADAAYLALKARDARFDGRLYVGVTSTGVYCRPICRVRTPRRENCRFFENAAQAEHARFRPCLKCRPEVAPGRAWSVMDASRTLARQATDVLDALAADTDADVPALAALAARLGVSDRHLRRIFAAEHGVTPLDYLQTRRLLLAKQLLTDSALPVTQIALASGFRSVRRFNAAFVERYRMSPTRLRSARDGVVANHGIAAATLRLGYRPPYDRAAMLGFVAARAMPGVEVADALGWRRTIALDHRGERLAGWFALRFQPARDEVEVRLAPSLLPALGALAQRLRAALDLDADPQAMAASPFATAGVRVPGSVDGFETAVRIVLGQQVTVAAARTLARRLIERFGTRLDTPFDDLTMLFPSPAALAEASPEAIGTLGIVRQRVRALQALAREVADGRIALHRGAPLDDTLAALRALPGVGEWTVQLIALRALGWPDAFPSSDLGVLNALGTRSANEALAQAEAWRPWRSYAVIGLWNRT
jgi:AraC family transcriptional regulator of adaptative response / DNA-3-methyladenine glycosylase II